MSVDDPHRPEAVTLFIERAHAADPSFALSAENAAAIAGLVRRLDGLPLAIELAAARVRALPPAALVTRLAQQPLRLLTGGLRDQPDRQHTMRDAIAWSYDLLAPAEQRLFRTLSVFVGGFTLEAAAAVAAAPEDGELDVLDGITSLLDKSLIRRMNDSEAEPRFTILETVREYGLEQLAAIGEEIAIRDAHVDWVVTMAEQAEAGLLGREQGRWLKQLEVEHANLRAVLGWLEHTGNATTRLRVASAVWLFWYIRGHLSEGRAWLERALTDGEDASPWLRARALFAVSVLAFGQTDYHTALAFAEASMTLADSFGDTRGVALAHFVLGLVAQLQGDNALAVTRLEEALAQWRQVGDTFWIAATLTQLGVAHTELPDLIRAVVLLEEASTLMREFGDVWTKAWTLSCLGVVVLDQGDIARADELFRESLASWWDIDDRWFISNALAGLAMIAERQGQPQRAARLVGTVESVCQQAQAPFLQDPAQAARYERTIDAVRTQLGDEAFAAARAAGRAMPLAEAIREAMVKDISGA